MLCARTLLPFISFHLLDSSLQLQALSPHTPTSAVAHTIPHPPTPKPQTSPQKKKKKQLPLPGKLPQKCRFLQVLSVFDEVSQTLEECLGVFGKRTALRPGPPSLECLPGWDP